MLDDVSLSKEMRGTPDSNPSPTPSPPYGLTQHKKLNHWQHFLDGFKRDPNHNALSLHDASDPRTARTFDHEGAAENTVRSPLVRRLKGRHLQMIAIGGSIGTGLFVGSGSALATGGPASLIIAFGIIGIMLYCTVQALGEMAVLFPVAGSFSAFSTRFIDPAWGMAMGYNYALQWLVTLPLEIVAATITIQFWNDSINGDAFVVIFLAVIVIINIFGVKGYGEVEFVLSIIKIIAVVAFNILGIVLVAGESTTPGGYVGGRYWRDPGPFANGFKGLCSVFVTAAFAFAGTELVGLAAAETENPRLTLPTASRQVTVRVFLFYILSLTFVGLLVPSTNPNLINASGANTKYSPFVIAISSAGIAVLPSIFNVVIMLAVISVGNSSVYGSSRTLAALADQGQAPAILGYVDKRGRPLVAIAVALAFGLLAFFAGSELQIPAFNWMIALSGLSSIFTWGSICLAHIRFRRAWALQGHSLSELAFTSQPGVLGSWLGLILNVLVLIAQFWTGFAPVGYGGMSSSARVMVFFESYLAAPIVLVSYVGFKWWFRTPVMRALDMDLRTGRREIDVQAALEEEREERRGWPKWKVVMKWFC